MKYFILFAILITTSAYAGRLSEEWVEGRSRFCKYDMGNVRYHVLVVDSHSRCPRNYP